MKTVAGLALTIGCLLAGCEPPRLPLNEDLSIEPRDLALPSSEEPDLAMKPRADLAMPTDGGTVLMPSPMPTRYPAGALHSPMTRAVIDRLAVVLAAQANRADVFAKVGDSITADPNFLNCFSGSDIMLGASAALEPTRVWFDTVDVGGGKTSFDRTSAAAMVSWNVDDALAGAPSPLDTEIMTLKPGFAVVMFGTNTTDACCVESFERELTRLVDALLAKGVVPLVSTIPPRGDSPTANALVPEMNAVIRAVAQRRQVMYLDYWQTLIGLVAYGMNPDGVHPKPYNNGSSHPCWLTDPALLEGGINQRNKITLAALDRAKAFLVDDAPADTNPTALSGKGTFTSPYVVDALPFVDVGDTSTSTSSTASVYSGGTCTMGQNEGGPEVVYRITVAAPATLRARVFVDSGVDVDLHWLTGPSPTMCQVRNDKVADFMVQPGTYYLAADTYVSAGVPKPGPFRITIVELN